MSFALYSHDKHGSTVIRLDGRDPKTWEAGGWYCAGQLREHGGASARKADLAHKTFDKVLRAKALLRQAK